MSGSIHMTTIFSSGDSLVLVLYGSSLGTKFLTVSGETVAAIFAQHPYAGRAVLVHTTPVGPQHKSPTDNSTWREPSKTREWERVGDGPIVEISAR